MRAPHVKRRLRLAALALLVLLVVLVSEGHSSASARIDSSGSTPRRSGSAALVANSEATLIGSFVVFEHVAYVEPNRVALGPPFNATFRDCLGVCESTQSCRSGAYVEGMCTLYLAGLSPVTRFAALAFMRRNQSSEAPTEPAVYAGYRRPNILYSMISTVRYPGRIFAALNTYLKTEHVIVFFESRASRDEANFDEQAKNVTLSLLASNPNCRSVFLNEPADPNYRSFNGAWKNIDLLRYIFEHRLLTGFDYFVTVDDDTFMFRENLEILLRWHLNDGVPVYMGALVPSLHNMLFIHGGGGIVMSISALAAVEKSILDKSSPCSTVLSLWGDVRLGYCFAVHDVRWQHCPSFFPEDIHVAVLLLYMNLKAAFPISIHRVSSQLALQMHFVGETALKTQRTVGWTSLKQAYDQHWYKDRHEIKWPESVKVRTFPPAIAAEPPDFDVRLLSTAKVASLIALTNASIKPQ